MRSVPVKDKFRERGWERPRGHGDHNGGRNSAASPRAGLHQNKAHNMLCGLDSRRRSLTPAQYPLPKPETKAFAPRGEGGTA